jgi:hypothetical protein
MYNALLVTLIDLHESLETLFQWAPHIATVKKRDIFDVLLPLSHEGCDSVFFKEQISGTMKKHLTS